MVTWQASTVAVVASIVAIVGGTVAGRLAWTAIARQVGVVADAVTPVSPLIAVAVAAFVAPTWWPSGRAWRRPGRRSHAPCGPNDGRSVRCCCSHEPEGAIP
ncbi:MAG: hypothetical protein ACR2MB_02710 [Acidimicrobiales bacterium]